VSGNRLRDLKECTKAFALRPTRLYSLVPNTSEVQVVGRQLLRSGTPVGANHREASRARLSAEFVSKLGIVLQEVDETAYWPELLVEAEIMPQARVAGLMNEANELIAIFVSSLKIAKKGRS